MDESNMDKSNTKKSNEPRKPTEAQIGANRRNAQKSTGPRTPEGRAASSRNRLVHGLRANKHLLLDEDPEEFLILLKDLHDRFRPVGEGEEELVMRIASGQWRLHRTLPMEAGIYRERLQAVAAEDFARKRELVNHKRNHELNPERVPPAPAPPDAGDRLTRAFDVDCARRNSLANLARYETSIERSIDRCLRQLEKFQAARHASAPNPEDQPSPLPAQPLTPHSGAENAESPAATPPEPMNYHSNPKNEGIAQSGALFGAAALALVIYALLHAVPGSVPHAFPPPPPPRKTEQSLAPVRITLRHAYGNLPQEAIDQMDLIPSGSPARGRGTVHPEGDRPRFA
jgi:hypothetical protein